MANTRALAAVTLAEVISDGVAFNGEASDSLRQRFGIDDIPASERALFRELVFGTLRQYHRLDFFLSQLLRKPLAKKDSDIHSLLLIGVYQLAHTRVPDHAAINETVAATRQLKKPWASGLANGVLRNWQRRGEKLQSELPADSGALLSHPEWLLQQLQQDWPEDWQQIAAAGNTQPVMALRVNALQGERYDYLAQLSGLDLAAESVDLAATAIRLRRACNPSDLPGFDAGAASIQDCGAQLTPGLLDPQPGDRVLDACAAPGGKTCHLLEYQPECSILAVDVDSNRLLKVEQNLARIGLEAELETADASTPGDWATPLGFDRILVDAPCSGTGVISHHPDIKLLRRPDDASKFAGQQLALLRALWPSLATGGTLLYCTCSVLREENEAVIAAFLAEQPDAIEAAIEADWGKVCLHGRQLLPNPDKNDGFFYARLSKSAAV